MGRLTSRHGSMTGETGEGGGGGHKGAGFGDWLTWFSRYVSIHGIVWYDRAPNRSTKAVLCLVSAVAFIAIPFLLVSNLDNR